MADIIQYMDTIEQIHMTLIGITVTVIIVIIIPLIITETMDIQETPIIHGRPLLKDIVARHEVIIHGIKVLTQIQRATAHLRDPILLIILQIKVTAVLQDTIAQHTQIVLHARLLREAPALHVHLLQDDNITNDFLIPWIPYGIFFCISHR